MRNKQHITKEIVELSAIKASYNHYLASGRSIFEVENSTMVYYNLGVINKSLRELYVELKNLGTREKGLGRREETGNGKQAVSNWQLATGNDEPRTNQQPFSKSYFQSPEFKALEAHAIMKFNSDKRFSITE